MFYAAVFVYSFLILLYFCTQFGILELLVSSLENTRIGTVIVKVVNFIFKLIMFASQYVVICLLMFLVGSSLLTWHTNTIINTTKNENVELQSMLCNVVEPYAIEAAQNGTLAEKINTMPDLIEFVNGSESLCNEDNVLETIELYLKNCDYINDLETEKKLYTSIRHRILN